MARLLLVGCFKGTILAGYLEVDPATADYLLAAVGKFSEIERAWCRTTLSTVMKILIWDFDGTLAHRPGNWSGALLELLDAGDAGHGFTREQIAGHLQSGFPWHEPERLHPELTGTELWWENLQPLFRKAFMALGYEAERAGSFARSVRDVYCAIGSWALYPETIDVLEELGRDGYRHLILSNHVPELPAIVSQLGLDRLVSDVFTSAAIGAEKPHPAAFEFVRRAFPDARRLWMIGDSPTADIDGAERSGIPAILVRRQTPECRRSCAELTGVRRFVLDDA